MSYDDAIQYNLGGVEFLGQQADTAGKRIKEITDALYSKVTSRLGSSIVGELEQAIRGDHAKISADCDGIAVAEMQFGKATTNASINCRAADLRGASIVGS